MRKKSGPPWRFPRIVPTTPKSRNPWGARTLLVLFLFFLFRFLFGLSTDIWFVDQHQIYLLGLKFYTTGAWPYFGPDVAAHIQLPGALQGLVVGLPLYLLPIPEAPYLFLAILSFSALSFFAWYCSKRLPHFPPWIIWTWLLTAPWVLNWSTNIDNDSYALFGAILFFIGFLETVPALTHNIISPNLANYMMGFSIYWCVQFHMSWVILLPFFCVSIYLQSTRVKKEVYLKKCLNILLYLFFGIFTTGIFLLPNFIKGELGGINHAVTFNPGNFTSFFTVLARFLSLASCEIPRFMGANSGDRLNFLKGNPWIAPFAVTAAILGIVQTLTLLLSGFRAKHPQKDWNAVRLLALSTFLLIYLSFLFAIKTPAAHTYYITLPIAMLYGFYALSPWAGTKWFLNTAKVLLVCNLMFHAGLALRNFPDKSLYKNRDLFVKAIQEKNYHLLGERRPDTLY